jgi:4-hydroxybenzoate polyprenyltransferase
LGEKRPDCFLGPVALAGLIVAIATLAWTIYNDQRDRAKDREPEPGSVTRQAE